MVDLAPGIDASTDILLHFPKGCLRPDLLANQHLTVGSGPSEFSLATSYHIASRYKTTVMFSNGIILASRIYPIFIPFLH